MPRKARVTPGGLVFHVLNRGVGRRQLFETEADYDAFERIIAETLNKCPMSICGYCLIPIIGIGISLCGPKKTRI